TYVTGIIGNLQTKKNGLPYNPHVYKLTQMDHAISYLTDPDCMQWSPCSEAQCIPIECSGFYAAWPKASRLNAVDFMHCD
ncbi:hypothetical protein PSY80_23980, partial [Shigella flexneri]|nr:hypothetical protein [Shigella flexneri]